MLDSTASTALALWCTTWLGAFHPGWQYRPSICPDSSPISQTAQAGMARQPLDKCLQPQTACNKPAGSC